MKEISYWWILSHLILNWLTLVRLFLKMIKLRSWAMDRISD
jgi:hypothetical protein